MYRLCWIVGSIGVCHIAYQYHYYKHRDGRRYQQLWSLINKTTIQWLKQQQLIVVGMRCAQQFIEEDFIASVAEQCRPFLMTVYKLPISGSVDLRGSASGFIVDNNLGLVITNNHAIYGSDYAKLGLFNESLRYCDVFIGDQNQSIIREMYGRVVYTAPDRDLALIRLPPIRPNVLPVCQFSTTDSQPGDTILTFCASNDRCLLSNGLVLTLDTKANLSFLKKFQTTLIDDKCNVLIYTGFVAPGYSGGPVINMFGQVVCINSLAGLGMSDRNIGITSKTIMDFIDEGKEYILSESVEVMHLTAKQRKPKLINNKTLGLVLVNNQIIDITFASQTIRQYLLINDEIVSYNNIEFTTPEAMSTYVQQLADNAVIVLNFQRLFGFEMYTIDVQPINVEQFKC
ncbi:uncharacterized protein LOC128960032 [Oppia nitens]|uniref:uncharacterized protein LOC128960032 n=1 Tax=Oppia nitens TaxID=1686743 RepID=UPI0023DBC501|nr:uncharacterized protein LOC128960032 [Oppia nitens]